MMVQNIDSPHPWRGPLGCLTPLDGRTGAWLIAQNVAALIHAATGGGHDGPPDRMRIQRHGEPIDMTAGCRYVRWLSLGLPSHQPLRGLELRTACHFMMTQDPATILDQRAVLERGGVIV